MRSIFVYPPSPFHRLLAWWAGRSDGKRALASALEPGQITSYERKLLIRGDSHIKAVHRTRNEDERNLEKRQNFYQAAAIRQAKQTVTVRNELRKGGVAAIYGGFSARAYWICIVFIAVGEFAFNAIAFQIFDQGKWETDVMAMAAAVSLPGMAHFLGLSVKQEDKRLKNLSLAMVGLLVTLGALYGLNYSRMAFLKENGATVASQTAMQWAFYSINLLIFTFAWTLAFFAHEEHSLLSKLKNWENDYQGSLKHIALALGARAATLTSARDFVGEISDGSRLLCSVYQRSYARHRRDDHLPTYFGKTEALTTREPAPASNRREGESQGSFCWWMVPEFETTCEDIQTRARNELLIENQSDASLTDGSLTRFAPDTQLATRRDSNASRGRGSDANGPSLNK